jgi:Protein of unknown function (DUF4089)
LASPGLEPELEQDAIAAYVDRAAAIVGLPIAAAHRPEVIEQFGRLLAVAALFMEFPLPEAIEPGPVFRP